LTVRLFLLAGDAEAVRPGLTGAWNGIEDFKCPGSSGRMALHMRFLLNIGLDAQAEPSSVV